MLYRYTQSQLRIPTDLYGIFENQSCFLAGGAPSLKDEKVELLGQPGINVMAMNNTASLVPCNLWIGCDKPPCYCTRIIKDPRIMKFGVISRRDWQIDGVKWKHYPNTYFMATTDKYFGTDNFLNMHRDYVWWKNTFYIAIQLLYRLGFRKIYLVGCSFAITKDSQYSYNTKLTEGMVSWNQKTYNTCANNMKKLKNTFKQYGVDIVSATPNSPLNDIYRHISFDQAVEEVLKDFPPTYDTSSCKHSSEMKKEEKKDGD